MTSSKCILVCKIHISHVNNCDAFQLFVLLRGFPYVSFNFYHVWKSISRVHLQAAPAILLRRKMCNDMKTLSPTTIPPAPFHTFVMEIVLRLLKDISIYWFLSMNLYRYSKSNLLHVVSFNNPAVWQDMAGGEYLSNMAGGEYFLHIIYCLSWTYTCMKEPNNFKICFSSNRSVLIKHWNLYDQ